MYVCVYVRKHVCACMYTHCVCVPACLFVCTFLLTKVVLDLDDVSELFHPLTLFKIVIRPAIVKEFRVQ